MYSGKNGSLFLKSDKAISGENLNMLKDCLAPDCLTTLSNQSPTAKKSLLHKGETKDTSIVDWTQCGNSECRKWRALPPLIKVAPLPECFTCEDNTGDRAELIALGCDAPQEEYED
jgi:hypothetical protein